MEGNRTEATLHHLESKLLQKESFWKRINLNSKVYAKAPVLQSMLSIYINFSLNRFY